MERVFLGALGFDLYVPRDQYEACVSELHGVVTGIAGDVAAAPAPAGEARGLHDRALIGPASPGSRRRRRGRAAEHDGETAPAGLSCRTRRPCVAVVPHAVAHEYALLSSVILLTVQRRKVRQGGPPAAGHGKLIWQAVFAR